MRTLSLRVIRKFLRLRPGAVLGLIAAVADLDVTATLALLAIESRYTGRRSSDPRAMRIASDRRPGVAIATSPDFGIDIDAKEAIAFAILGYQTWHRRPANLPSATGAQRAVVLGKITP